MSRKITDEELLNELIILKEKLGRNPKQNDLKLGKYSENAYKRAFGGISKALIQIGEEPTFYRNLNKEDVVLEMQKIYCITNKLPTIDSLNKYAKLSYSTVIRIFNNKSWHLILEECGFNIIKQNGKRIPKYNITEEELYKEIIRLKELLGRVPGYYDMQREGKFSPETYAAKLGTYVKALHYFGFTDYVPQNMYYNQIYAKGNDNQIYKSAFEANTANYLLNYKNNNLIKDYKYEQIIYKEKSWKWTCDFVIERNDGKLIYLECDGMAHNRKNPYDENNGKINYYIENNMNYIILGYREDENKLKEILNIL